MFTLVKTYISMCLIVDMSGKELIIGIWVCRIRVPYPFQWGTPSFDAGEAFAMMMTSFVALVEVCFISSF